MRWDKIKAIGAAEASGGRVTIGAAAMTAAGLSAAPSAGKANAAIATIAGADIRA